MVKPKRSWSAGRDINRSAETHGRYMSHVMITSMLFCLLFIQPLFYSSPNAKRKKHFPSHYSSRFFYWYRLQEKEEIMFSHRVLLRNFIFIHHASRFLVSPSTALLLAYLRSVTSSSSWFSSRTRMGLFKRNHAKREKLIGNTSYVTR